MTRNCKKTNKQTTASWKSICGFLADWSHFVSVRHCYKKKVSNKIASDIKPLCLHPGVYIMIGLGAIMMVVGFLGCYGAIQESQCLLGTVSHCHTSPCPETSVLFTWYISYQYCEKRSTRRGGKHSSHEWKNLSFVGTQYFKMYFAEFEFVKIN